jgi:hypothetical protein
MVNLARKFYVERGTPFNYAEKSPTTGKTACQTRTRATQQAQETAHESEQDRAKNQIYDSTTKGVLHKNARDMIPYLLPGATYLETLNIEVVRPTMRADRVYRVIYRGREHISHLEFQTSYDRHLATRLLVYNSILHQDYNLPVITVVIYTFETTLAKSPLVISSGDEEIIRFNFRTLLLFEDDGTTYAEKHAICMYPFLPAMRNVDATLALQVGEEMIAHYGRDSDDLKEQLTWMRVFFEKTTTITPEEKQKIWEVFIMLGLDKLLDESPWIQRERAKGEAKGELKTSRTLVVQLVNARFPALTDLARQKVASMTQPEALSALLIQIGTAPNEDAARSLLLPQEPS